MGGNTDDEEERKYDLGKRLMGLRIDMRPIKS
jgi:hypothetical protein